jgi:hypothetical protein
MFRGGALLASVVPSYLGCFVQDHVQQRIMQFQMAIVTDESQPQPSKFIL